MIEKLISLIFFFKIEHSFIQEEILCDEEIYTYISCVFNKNPFYSENKILSESFSIFFERNYYDCPEYTINNIKLISDEDRQRINQKWLKLKNNSTIVDFGCY